MYYVELHAAQQSKLADEPSQRWKFNKAKQGWLMRNVWNETEVSNPRYGQVKERKGDLTSMNSRSQRRTLSVWYSTSRPYPAERER